ncbi:hypothetical protein TWF192_006343 [Orbilia oligospora]|uniref:Uncharacterized protein n=2 Tax=Orbilia oligospora TaxID=2813651 RepID=A0A6G1M948_ORBOL|nr:hypothetical protein TWF679_011007 [Orbilia oligospora]KAF3248349.1 hypothetical protein TWF192_006343 [Orbilia oligospora]
MDEEDVHRGIEDEMPPRTPSPTPSGISAIPASANVATGSGPRPTRIPSPKTPTHRLRRYLVDTKVPELRAKGRELAKRLRLLGQQAKALKRKVISPSGDSIMAGGSSPKKAKMAETGALPAPQIKKRPQVTLRRPPMNLGKQKTKLPSTGNLSGSETESTLAVATASEILAMQMDGDHKRREEDLAVRLEEIKGDIKQQALEAIEQFKAVYQTTERNNYAQIKELMQGLSDAFGATDMQMNHIRWQYPKDKNTKPLVNRYREIAHRIDVGIQEKKEASEKMRRIEAKVEESYNKCMKLLDVIDGENYAIDFQYGVAIHGEEYMKKHYDVPKGYKTPANSAGIIPRLNHIQETLTDMINKEPNFTAHSEWFYNDLLKKAIEKVRNEEADHMTGINSE